MQKTIAVADPASKKGLDLPLVCMPVESFSGTDYASLLKIVGGVAIHEGYETARYGESPSAWSFSEIQQLGNVWMFIHPDGRILTLKRWRKGHGSKSEITRYGSKGAFEATMQSQQFSWDVTCTAEEFILQHFVDELV